MSGDRMRRAVIVATARTAIGRAGKGSFTDVRPDDLSAFIIRAALEKVPQLPVDEIEDVIWGCGEPAGEAGDNIARVASVLAGLNAPGVTVNRYCASSLQSISMAAHAVAAGAGDVFVAGGVESVSRYEFGVADGGPPNPGFDTARSRSLSRSQGGAPVWSPAPGLPDVYIEMGQTAENVREREGVSRLEMDSFAVLSQQRAFDASRRGFFAEEISPFPKADGSFVSVDESPRAGVDHARLAELPPAFRPDGEITAGNSCPLNDGAAAVVVMSAERAATLGITPLAAVRATSVSAIDPEIMGLGPIEASRKALARAGLTINDIDLIEINEAFAAQVIPSAAALGVSWDRLNVNGGAIALGHPFGMTGARILTTLIHSLQERDGTFGLETLCVGGGQGMALVVERLA